jgi:hypothetical protein
LQRDNSQKWKEGKTRTEEQRRRRKRRGRRKKSR